MIPSNVNLTDCLGSKRTSYAVVEETVTFHILSPRIICSHYILYFDPRSATLLHGLLARYANITRQLSHRICCNPLSKVSREEKVAGEERRVVEIERVSK